jgi:molecular chaperone GrpE
MSDEQNKPQEGVEAPAEEVTLSPLEQALKERDEYKTSWQRALADYANLQKETAARRQEWVSMSEIQILEEFIPVYDSFKKAFAQPPASEDKQIKNWVMGIGFIMKLFAEVFKAHKLEEIKTVGEKFDPKLHEAAGQEKNDSAPGTILREVDGGYTMAGRVVKVAKVIIAE